MTTATSSASDRTLTSDLLGRLRRHYIKDSSGTDRYRGLSSVASELDHTATQLRDLEKAAATYASKEKGPQP